jgi:hypothetical protein
MGRRHWRPIAFRASLDYRAKRTFFTRVQP